MKIRLFFALLGKEIGERFRGEGVWTLLLRAVLFGGLAAAFVWFYLKFAAVYLNLGEREERTFELSALTLALLLLLMSLGAATSLVRSVRLSGDLRLYAALPIPRGTLLAAKLASIALGQLFLSLFVLCVIGTAFRFRWEWIALAAVCLPLLSLGIGAILSYPVYAAIRFFRGKFFLSFLAGTAVFAVGLFLYSYLLSGVKELLLGGDLKYFFGEKVLRGIALAARFAYPANLAARLLSGETRALLFVGGGAIAALPLSLLLARGLLRGAYSFKAPPEPRIPASEKASPKFFALLKKEFISVFRTPAYVFSYFSVAVVMPLMVYFCMSVGGSLLLRLLGVDCTFELAVFLTLLYSSLTNVFCATNVSREGKMFCVLKGMPVRAGQVFAAKVLFCMLVVALSLLASSAALFFAGYLTLSASLFIFFLGLTFSFAQVCFATRYDFSHARFPSEAEGEVGEGSGFSLLFTGVALLVGGGLLALKLFRTLGFGAFPASYSALLAGGVCLVAALLSALYLFLHLKRRYEAFAGGNV